MDGWLEQTDYMDRTKILGEYNTPQEIIAYIINIGLVFPFHASDIPSNKPNPFCIYCRKECSLTFNLFCAAKKEGFSLGRVKKSNFPLGGEGQWQVIFHK